MKEVKNGLRVGDNFHGFELKKAFPDQVQSHKNTFNSHLYHSPLPALCMPGFYALLIDKVTFSFL